MVKISKPLGGEKVSTYFRVEFSAADQLNYMREGEKQLIGEWHGKFAEEQFGLVGGVDELHYDRMAQGQHPHTGEQLIKHRTQTETRKWLTDDKAWRQRLEEMFLERGAGLDPLRVPTASEYRAVPDPPKVPTDKVVRLERTEREKLLIRMQEAAAKVFAANLAGDQGAAAREYLNKRGVTPEARAEFGLGATGPRDQILEHLRMAGFADEDILAAGLARTDDRGKLRDHFFGSRVMFPIHDAHGEIVGFTGRSIEDGGSRYKYVNSPATEIYRKSDIVYNLHRAAAEGTGRLVGVEGQMDVIGAWQSGVRDVVALSGTALSEAQIESIKRTASDVLLSLDVDENRAGQTAAEKHTGTLLSAGIRVRGVDVPGDPDEFVREKGGEAYRAELAEAKPLVEWLATHAREKFDITTGNPDRALAETEAVKWTIDQLAKVTGPERETISKEVARYLKVEEPAEDEKPKHVEHISAWDMTFAPSKSYSAAALVGGDKRIIDWHKKALKEALDAGEEYTQARLGGNRGSETTGRWAAACFMHDTARPVYGGSPNPHLHSHTVVFNMTRAADKIRSVQAQEWYRIQSYMSATYQAAMAQQALAGGYELEHSKNFSTRIKGFSDEYLDAISARTREIEEEKAAKGLVGAEADELVNKRLRAAKQKWQPEALREEHRRQAEEFGQDVDGIVAASKERPGIRLSKADRIKLSHEAIDWAKDRLQESQSVNDHYEIMRDALRYGLGRIRLADVREAFEERLAQEEKEFVRVEHYRESAPGARYTTEKARGVEAETIRMVLAGQGKTGPIAGAVTRDEFRAKYKERVVGGRKIELNDSQLWMAYRVVTEPNQYAVIRGAAGTGKSTSLRPVAEIAALGVAVGELKQSGFDVRGLASTSGAAGNLSEIGIKSETLQAHNMRGVPADAKKRLYVVDEGSLVGAEMFYTFVKSVRPQDRVIIAYDPRQHQAVEAGRIIEELEEAGVAIYKLEKIVRQMNTPELLAVVNDFKAGRMVDGLEKLDDQGRIWEAEDRRSRLRLMAINYATREDCLMVAPDNRTIGELNGYAREVLRLKGKLGEDCYAGLVLVGLRDVRQADKRRAVTYEAGNMIRWGSKSLGGRVQSGEYSEVLSVDAESNLVTIRTGGGKLGAREITYDPAQASGVEIYESAERKFAVGERIQITRPWAVSRSLKIANRAQATIKSLDSTGAGILEFADGRQVKWDARQMPHADYAYAMTSYSLQFATADSVLVHIDCGDSRIRSLVDRALLYVGASRGANGIEVYTDDKSVLLSDQSPVNRMTQKPTALSPAEISQRAGAMVA